MIADVALARKGSLVVAGFFALYFLLGVLIFRDYGLSWDERDHRITGQVNLQYVLGQNRQLATYSGWYVSPAFQMLLALAEKAAGLDYEIRSDAVFALYHFLTFTSFLLGLFIFHLLCRKLFGDWRYGLIACLIMALSPRVFAHSFYNPRDIPFMAAFIAGAYTLTRFVERPSLPRALLHGLCCGFATGVRIMGVLLPALTLLLLAYDLLVRPRPRGAARTILLGVPAFLGSCAGFTVLFWPLLWADPLGNFAAAFRTASHHPWGGMVLYLGKYLLAVKIPWHYFFVWIGVTTPLAFVALFGLGLPWLLAGFLRHPLAFGARQRHLLLVLLWFLVPFSIIISLASTVYDEWRHVLFVYPALVIVATFGLRFFIEQTLLRTANRLARGAGVLGIALIAVNALATAGFMVRSHPFENVYFNRLAGRTLADAKKAFEFDYWGLSYKRAFEYILSHESSPKIKVCVLNEGGVNSSWSFRKADRERLVFVRLSEAPDYFVGNYRIHKEEYDYGREVFFLKVGDAKIVTVRRMKGA